jgi:hypothetical protein
MLSEERLESEYIRGRVVTLGPKFTKEEIGPVSDEGPTMSDGKCVWWTGEDGFKVCWDPYEEPRGIIHNPPVMGNRPTAKSCHLQAILNRIVVNLMDGTIQRSSEDATGS